FASATLLDGREVMALFPDLSPRLMGMLIGTSIFGSVGSLLLANALGAPPLGRSLKLGLAGRARQWLYGSRVGEWTMKLVRSARRGNPVELVARPTEMALGLAAADLFAALPRELKSQLSEVPAVVHRLEERAVEARRRVDELQALHREAESEAAHAASAKGASADDSLMARRSETVRQLTAARDVARDELARTVAALERIRLDLLRLAAGSARPVDATTMLDAAQRAVEEIELVASAQREVNELALPSRVPSAPDPLASTPA